MEIFDIVDEQGNPTGETVERTKAHELGIRHRTAHIWIVREKENGYDVLLQKRSMNKDSFPGGYDTSSAGHIQAGDEPLESAIRELGEELGINAEEKDLTFAGNFQIEYQTQFHGKIFWDNEITFVYVYNGIVHEESLKLQEEEVERVDWFDLDLVKEECKKGNEKFVMPAKGLQVLINYLEGENK